MLAELKQCVDVSKEYLFGLQVVLHELLKHNEEEVDVECLDFSVFCL